MNDKEFMSWLNGYGKAWQDGNLLILEGLFAKDALYYETPFDRPLCGIEEIKEYWLQGAVNSQKDVQFRFHEFMFDERMGFCRWTSSFVRLESDISVKIEGALMARFNDVGECVCFREWWHRVES